jgi:hypothetical protein
MGLDMYLVGHHYNTAYKDDVPRPMLDNKYHIESMNVDLGYWRKHADLHGYIINTFAKGVDECQKIELSEDDLDKIIKAIKNDELQKHLVTTIKKKKIVPFQFFKEQKPFCKRVQR